jgi:hypothetical protein
VLSGAVSVAQLHANLAAFRLNPGTGLAADLDLTEPPDEYWTARAARPWA